MKRIRAVLRLLIISILLMFAVCGIGITGNFLNTNNERYRNREIRTEQVEKKEDEEIEEKVKG